ncbi:hypothetical protein RIF29_13950 [Crotalaria pallida]|uniref:Uncharacterized protein n=1 Tax=Crotalaria pallida TaxID=3830 RepID=A0AAN9FGM2_CROPI
MLEVIAKNIEELKQSVEEKASAGVLAGKSNGDEEKCLEDQLGDAKMVYDVDVIMQPLEDGDWKFLDKGWKWRGDVSMVVDDPHFTPMGIDLWEMMERIKLDDPEYVKVLVLPENDGRFDDIEEDLEWKEGRAKDDDQ